MAKTKFGIRRRLPEASRLCLTRQIDQAVIIGAPGSSPVAVTIADVCGDQVRLLIEADKDVNIAREELLNREGG